MGDDFVLQHDQVEASLATMEARFGAVAERLRTVYGLRLPRHLAVLAAFFDSLGKPGCDVVSEDVGLTPGGITRYFEDGGLALTARDGLDERLECRFRRDPPEFVTVMWGHTDGLHYGLWYDDPAELPSFVAHNYARDSAETWTEGLPTALSEIRRILGKIDADIASDPGHEYSYSRHREQLYAAVDAFGEADRRASEQDGPIRWADAARRPVLGSPGPALPDGAGDPRGGYGQYEQRYQGYRARSPQVREWIAEAERELAAGLPAYALVLGQELHWMDADDYRDDSLRLLTSAYRALGRDALAGIAAVHHAHRDLPSVGVLAP